MGRLPAAIRPPVETREQLTQAARWLFAAQGFDGVGIREVAERAGVNAALIQYHFGGKRGLLNHVLREDLTQAVERLRARVAQAATARAKLTTFADAMVALRREYPSLPFILTREQMDGGWRLEPDVRNRLFDFFRITSSILETGWATGELRPLSPHAAHLSLMGALIYFSLTEPARTTYERQGGAPGDPLTPDAYARHVGELFERGWAASVPSAPRRKRRARPERRRT